MEFLRQNVFELSIVLGNVFFALSLVIGLYRKHKKHDILFFLLHVLCVFILECLFTALFSYLIGRYSFRFKHLIVSALYLLPLPFLDNKSSYRAKIPIACTIYATFFVLGEIGGSIPILVRNWEYAKILDTILRNGIGFTSVFFALFVRKFSLTEIEKVPSAAIVFLSVYSVCESGLTFYSSFFFHPMEWSSALFRFLSFFVICVINYLSYFRIYSICHKNDQFIHLQARNRELEKNQELIAVSDENLQKLKEIKHDTKNQYAIRKSLLEKKQYDELDKFFESYGDGIIEPLSFISSDNRILSSVLNRELAKANANKIGFDVKVAVEKELPFESTDLVSLLSNLIDNSIEACLYYHIDQPRISIRIREYMDYLYIEIKNPVGENVTIEQLKQIKTTKKDKELHGYGNKIVRQIVRRYDGVREKKVEENQFIVKIRIRKEKRK